MNHIEIVKKLRLVQTPPQTRTIFWDNNLRRINFPHLSIGSVVILNLDKFHRYGETPFVRVVVGVHSKPWKDEAEAIETLREFYWHRATTQGMICVGEEAGIRLARKEITPSEAFWMTGFNERGHFDFNEMARNGTIILPHLFSWFNQVRDNWKQITFDEMKAPD